MINGSVVSEELRWQDFGKDGQSDCTPRPVFAFGDEGKYNKKQIKLFKIYNLCLKFFYKKIIIIIIAHSMPLTVLPAHE